MRRMLLFLIIGVLFFLPLGDAKIFVDVDIPPGYLVVHPGERIHANLIINSAEKEKNDYALFVYILDEKGNIIMEDTKIIAIHAGLSTIAGFELPEHIKPGNYHFKAVIEDSESKANFIIEEKAQIGNDRFLFYGLMFILLVFIIGLYWYNRKLNKLINQYGRASLKELVKKRRI